MNERKARSTETSSSQELLARLAQLESKLDEALWALSFLQRRSATYLGSGDALTYLADETPIYVNSNDFGPPANLINGGRYETDNLATLLSFVSDDTVFLDVGANLGFFALQIARRTVRGIAHAFEPHPRLARLLRASAHLNGLSNFDASAGRLICHQVGLGDVDAKVAFGYPPDHLGGGGVHGVGEGHESVIAEIRAADGLFPPDFTCDLVKIDVEGHELATLRGMKGILSRSPKATVLFEKLDDRGGRYEAEIEAYFAELGFTLYGVLPGARLRPIEPGALQSFAGYALATREGAALAEDRRRIVIHPRQLQTPAGAAASIAPEELKAQAHAGELLFHGPYWHLTAGQYRLSLRGKVEGQVTLGVAARLGQIVHSAVLSGENPSMEFVAPRDLALFELVARASSAHASVTTSAIEIVQIG